MDRETQLKMAAAWVVREQQFSDQIKELAIYGNQLMRYIADHDYKSMDELSAKYDRVLRKCKANVKEGDKTQALLAAALDLPVYENDIEQLVAVLAALQVTEGEVEKYHFISRRG